MTKAEQYYEMVAEKSAQFKAENGISDMEMQFVDDIAVVTAMVSKFQEIFKTIPTDLAEQFSKVIFEVRQQLNDHFPMNVGGDTLASTCIMCWSLEMPLDECPHEQHIRMALLAMAAFRVSPPVDLGVDEPNMPDLDGEGMVKS